jgi:hypothetical protein
MQLTNKIIIQAAQILGDKHTIITTEVGGQDFVLFRTDTNWVIAFWYDGTILLHHQYATHRYKEVRNNFLGEIRLTVWLANQAS